MRFAATVLALLAVASPAAAAEITGPVLAGDRVVWGEKQADGSLTITERRRGTDRRLLAIPAPVPLDPDDGRAAQAFTSLAASSAWTAFSVQTFQSFFNGDVGGSASATRHLGSFRARAFAPAVPGCDRASSVATAAEGTRLVVGGSSLCSPDPSRFAGAVWLVRGDRPPRKLQGVPNDFDVAQVAIAGDYVAWSLATVAGDAFAVTVVRRRDRKVVADYDAADLGGPPRRFDLDARGRVIATIGGCTPACVTVRGLGAGRPRTLVTTASSEDVAIAAGRVAYFSPDRLEVVDLAGRAVTGFPAAGPAGLDLDGTRVAWSLSTGEILTRRLPS